MAKIPKNPEEIFEELINDYKNIFGENLISIILYGSSARGEYIRKKSDINFLIILSEQGLRLLGNAFPIVKKWRKRAVSVPLFLTKEYIYSSLDSFPIEFYNIKQAYNVVYGDDILREITINNKELRLQLEKEIKGKLVHLRGAFFESGDDKRKLKTLFSVSLGAFLAMFPVILHLKGIEYIEKRKDLIEKSCEVMGLDKEIYTTLLKIRENAYKFSRNEGKKIWEKYVEQVEKIAFEIDELVV